MFKSHINLNALQSNLIKKLDWFTQHQQSEDLQTIIPKDQNVKHEQTTEDFVPRIHQASGKKQKHKISSSWV